MIEITVTYFPRCDTNEGPTCVSKKLTVPELLNPNFVSPNDRVQWEASKLYNIMLDNAAGMREEIEG